MFERRNFWNARAHSRACAFVIQCSSGAIGQRAVLIQQYPAEQCRGCEFEPHLEQTLSSLNNEAQFCCWPQSSVLSQNVIMVKCDLYFALYVTHDVLMCLHSIMHNALIHALLSTISLLTFVVYKDWPWRDLNTQPSDLESDALPLRHKATMYNIIWPPITWHCLNTGALVIYCRCECMCKPMKPYSESTVFRPYSFCMYNSALKLPVHVWKT